jgi:hypothetical protein
MDGIDTQSYVGSWQILLQKSPKRKAALGAELQA